MSDPKRIAVIGSNSFTGAHLVKYLLDETESEILGVSRSPEYDPLLLAYRYRQSPDVRRFSFLQLDVNEQLDLLLAKLEQFRPSIIFNFAAQGEVRNSWKWPEHWWRTNALAVARLAEGLRHKDWLERYVASSTPEVYGSTGANQAESDTYRPSTPYAASKLAGDLHLLALHRYEGFPVVLTRAANLYGMHQQLYRIIPRTIIRVQTGEPLELHGRGRARRAFIHARDVADATWRAATRGKTGEVYHLAPEEDLRSLADVVRLVCGQMGADFDKAVRLVDENFGQDDVFSLDAGKARRELGWLPRVAFEDGVRETIGWIHDNWEAIRRLPHEYQHQP
jgi:dTDP-glucose 4,6-dehydratase